jgi:predicted RND superfamily exporter protein
MKITGFKWRITHLGLFRGQYYTSSNDFFTEKIGTPSAWMKGIGINDSELIRKSEQITKGERIPERLYKVISKKAFKDTAEINTTVGARHLHSSAKKEEKKMFQKRMLRSMQRNRKSIMENFKAEYGVADTEIAEIIKNYIELRKTEKKPLSPHTYKGQKYDQAGGKYSIELDESQSDSELDETMEEITKEIKGEKVIRDSTTTKGKKRVTGIKYFPVG